MSHMTSNLILSGIGIASLLTLCLLWVVWKKASLRGRQRAERQVTGPDGVWSTRIHWTHPRAGLGVARMVFERKPKGRNADTRDEKPRSSSFGLGDLVPDEIAMVMLAVAAVVGLILAALVIVLLAIELAIFVFLVAVFATPRLFFGQRWSIEVVDPRGTTHLVDVKGLGEARRVQFVIRQEIELASSTSKNSKEHDPGSPSPSTRHAGTRHPTTRRPRLLTDRSLPTLDPLRLFSHF